MKTQNTTKKANTATIGSASTAGESEKRVYSENPADFDEQKTKLIISLIK